MTAIVSSRRDPRAPHGAGACAEDSENCQDLPHSTNPTGIPGEPAREISTASREIAALSSRTRVRSKRKSLERIQAEEERSGTRSTGRLSGVSPTEPGGRGGPHAGDLPPRTRRLRVLGPSSAPGMYLGPRGSRGRAGTSRPRQGPPRAARRGMRPPSTTSLASKRLAHITAAARARSVSFAIRREDIAIAGRTGRGKRRC